MKKLIIIAIFLSSALASFAQFIGVGAQYADAKGKGNAIQFAANVSFPYWYKENILNVFASSGIDYTGGSSPVAGMNIKPLMLTTYFSESLFNNYPFTVMAGVDAGYLYNFRHGKDGIVLTPNLYIDYKIFFVKAGYDFNVTAGKEQFYVRAGVCVGLGTLKMIPNTKIR